ncbi:helix-turn-helix domain-containing protein [Methanosarcina baikalica]|uniref:helix-turn-helix domain-containing protein n=1 Tax=Methanosarcina baikalica TaxID=3073890 RepID=UPI0037C7B6AB
MYLTAKVEICPTKEQTDALWKLSDQCKFLYNFAIDERKRHPTFRRCFLLTFFLTSIIYILKFR